MVALPTLPIAPAVGDQATATYADNVAAWIAFLAAPPLFVASQTTLQSLANATFVGNAIKWDTVTTDSYTGWATGSNTRYTAQVAGWYSVRGHITFVPNATGIRAVIVGLNGTNIAVSQNESSAVGAGGPPSVPVDHVLQMVVGDYIEVSAYQSSGAALNTQATYSWVTVKWEHA